MQWLSFAANEIQHSLSAARLVQKFAYALDYQAAVDKSSEVLRLLEQHLKNHDWLAIGRPSIADCAVYAYVVLAHEGSVDISGYSHIAQWIKRIQALPGYLPKP